MANQLVTLVINWIIVCHISIDTYVYVVCSYIAIQQLVAFV